jgi:transcriptional regulator with XRE-family HTH domain
MILSSIFCQNYDIFIKIMNFSDRLRAEIEYIRLNQKEFAAKAGIKRRALDAYLGVQKSMPPADIAVKIASALGLSVEYLVTGKEVKDSVDLSKYMQFREVVDDLSVIPDEISMHIKTLIKLAAAHQREKIPPSSPAR